MDFLSCDQWPSVIVIGGSTASGKTAMAIHLAEVLRAGKCRAEIINADSIQMYRDLRILTAYPSEQEFEKVPHNLFGVLGPHESSSVASWLKMAKNELKRLKYEEKIAIFCGGTGFYIKALLEGVTDVPDIPKEVREEVRNLFERIGRDAFFEKLSELDFEASHQLHKNDTQRILRAYEVVKFTGKPLNEWWRKRVFGSVELVDSPIKTIILLPEKEAVRERAASRIVKMLDSGAIEEVKAFNAQNPGYEGPLNEVIGYREICDFLRIESLKYEELIEKIRIRTNQYIKRQFTWFRNQLKNARLVSGFGDTSEVLEEVVYLLLSK